MGNFGTARVSSVALRAGHFSYRAILETYIFWCSGHCCCMVPAILVDLPYVGYAMVGMPLVGVLRVVQPTEAGMT